MGTSKVELTFDTTLRLKLPPTQWPDRQNIYVFNLYRSASSLVVLITRALSEIIGRVPIDVTQTLYNSGTALFDTGLSGDSVSYLSDANQLNQLGNFGGYCFAGYREVPLAFAEGFQFHRAAMLIVRDPRDIGISQYHAVHSHTDANLVAGDHIRRLRAQVADVSLHDFLLSDQTTTFLRRIVMGYRPMIERGMPVVLYEDMFDDGVFNLQRMAGTFVDNYEAYLPDDFSFDAFMDLINRKIKNSKALKGHATGGSIYNYSSLPDDVLDAYTNNLAEALGVLGY